MNTPQNPTPQANQMMDMQAALFELRDRLLNLKLSLQDLACLHDEQGRRQADAELNALLNRLRA